VRVFAATAGRTGIQWQQGLAPCLDNDSLVHGGQHAALPRAATAFEVFNGFPTRFHLWVVLGLILYRDANFAMLSLEFCIFSSDGVRGRGCAVS
jgi:hypothetical protein